MLITSDEPITSVAELEAAEVWAVPADELLERMRSAGLTTATVAFARRAAPLGLAPHRVTVEQLCGMLCDFSDAELVLSPAEAHEPQNATAQVQLRAMFKFLRLATAAGCIVEMPADETDSHNAEVRPTPTSHVVRIKLAAATQASHCQYRVEVAKGRRKPMATHQADAIVVAAALGDEHRFWVVPSARAGELGVLTQPFAGLGDRHWRAPLSTGDWQAGSGVIHITQPLLDGRVGGHGGVRHVGGALINERLEVTGNHSRLLELLHQATQRE